MEENYYWSDDYSSQFYVEAAKCGFITTSMYKDDTFILLPEIQFDYAVLEYEDMKISSKVKKMLKQDNYSLSINNHFDEVLNKINDYHEDSWLTKEYIAILNNINADKELNKNFKLLSIELVENEDKKANFG